MSNTKISEQGFWLEDSAEHKADLGLLHGLKVLMSKGSLVDFGCGKGTYARALADCNFQVKAFDGNPNVVAMTDGFAKVLDLSIPFNLEESFDFVLSLEVGEHIPAEFEQIFLDNLCRHAKKGVIISWALPGQGGHGHVNEQPNSYIIQEFRRRGFLFGKSQSNYLRSKSNDLPWFKNTLMVFQKEGSPVFNARRSDAFGARLTSMIRSLRK